MGRGKLSNKNLRRNILGRFVLGKGRENGAALGGGGGPGKNVKETRVKLTWNAIDSDQKYSNNSWTIQWN